MQDLVHSSAVYYDARGIRHIIKAEELEDQIIFQKAKTLVLFDSTEEVLVRPRDAPKEHPDWRRHFASKIKLSRRVLNVDRDPVHDKRVNWLADILNTSDDWNVFTYYHNFNEKKYEQLLLLKNYRWQCETHRIVYEDTTIRHDVFGQANRLSMSQFHPWMAIEVVNTHYPSEETFKVFVETSKNVPFMVCFDFTDRKNFFLKVECNDFHGVVIYTKLYIYKGIVWYEGKPTSISSSNQLESHVKAVIRRLQSASIK